MQSYGLPTGYCWIVAVCLHYSAASHTDHMTTSLRMDEDQSHMTEKIFNLTLDITFLLTGESFPPVKSGDYVTIMAPPPHFVISEKHKQKIVEIMRKMMELLTRQVPIRCQDVYFYMREWQFILGHRDLYKDTMMENQLHLTTPDRSSNSKPPKRCTGPLYFQDCPQEDTTIPNHYQGVKLIHESAVVKEEEETYVRSDQQSVEEGDMIKTIKKEEEETYVRSDQQSIEEGDMMRTIKKEEEETYVRSDQQSIEEGDMMRTIKKEEEETYVRSDQQSMEEGDMIKTIKKEEEETYVRSDQQSMEEGDMMRTSKEEDTVTEGSTVRSPGIRNLSETRPSVSTDCTTDDDVIGQESPADILVTPNIPPDSDNLSNPEGPHTQLSSRPAGRNSCSTCGKCFVGKSKLIRHERSHTGTPRFWVGCLGE
ncbi:gastrula zinc finger protein XlCGF53.1-like isoform X2 [Hyperolius riggenbachi]|uniref:gastrula zinc finger protein XlCGF53.1-like isoform X2 n=1 Tax=Hyperolius riggenbachi TaxID=752182 RepID=UPI0035A2EB5E